MINKNELRVGNKIYSGNNSNILTVDEIRYTTVRVSYIRSDTNQPHVSISQFEDFNPIPLSPDILEKCGFEKSKSASNMYIKVIHKIGNTTLKSIAVYLDENDCTVAMLDYYTGVEKTELFPMNYKYFHSLQNLIFAITSLELPFTNQ